LSEFNVVALVLARLPLAYGSLKRAVSRTAWARSLTARCSLAQASIHISRKIFSGFTPFPPKNPQFDHFKVPNLIPKMFTGQIRCKAFKHIPNLRLQYEMHKIHQIINTFSTFYNNTKSPHQFTNFDTHSINSTTTCSKSITTTNEHKFLHHSTTTTHNSSISLKNTKYSHTWNLAYKINNNLVINSFMYMNILSTSRTKFNIKIQISTYSQNQLYQ